jgi:glycine cleavage system H protein
MNVPNDLLYTKEHEWVNIEGNAGTVGVTDYAQHALGDLTYVELPKHGQAVFQFKNLASIESVKAASDIFAPLSGVVSAVNTELETKPGLINTSPYADGWIAKIKMDDPNEKANLMNAAAYKSFVEELSR